ncbi:hypothetical protein [Photorhabdus akhurstii]|uniref:hypothetical protein n=1 Tax=Photorhabdus akhurstii TaxID=171438 RepID=UPI001BD35773|nr:hypothetical protein [Photorhabdus akhurstii]
MGIKATPVEWRWMEGKAFTEKPVAGSAVARVHCQVMSGGLTCRPGDVVIAAE